MSDFFEPAGTPEPQDLWTTVSAGSPEEDAMAPAAGGPEAATTSTPGQADPPADHQWPSAMWTDPATGAKPVAPVAWSQRSISLKMAAALGAAVLAVAGVGIVIGHSVWSSSTSIRSSSPRFPGTFNPFGTPGSNGFGQIPNFPNFPSQPNGRSTSTPAAGAGSPKNVNAIATSVDPGLVDINVTFNYQGASGAGTGMVLTSSGEVLTNNHVIDGATSISVRDLGNGRTYAASVVGYDNSRDIAVLQLKNASGLATVSIAHVAAHVGEGVVAIGNAGGVGGTPTAAGGSVTATNQSITANDSLDGSAEQLTGLIGVNADVQSGDSGGPLVNALGRVVGMDTAASSGYGGFELNGGSTTTIGYAISIRTALGIARSIEAGQGSSTIHVGATAFLGLSLSTQSTNEFGGSPTATGADVLGVQSNSAANRAGLVAGDTVTSFNGHTVTTPASLTALLVTFHPGQSATIGWTDSAGASHHATVVLGSGPPA